MKKYLFIGTIALFITSSIKAQTFTLMGDRAYGGFETETDCRIVALPNHEYLIYGYSNTTVNGDKTNPLCAGSGQLEGDVWIIKLDSNFNIIWNRSYGGKSHEYPYDITLTSDNKLIFAGISLSDSACEKTEHNRGTPGSTGGTNDMWVCAIDTNNTKLWDKTLGTSNFDGYTQVIELNLGNVIVGGITAPAFDGDKTMPNYGNNDFWVIKLDSMGNKLWDKVYGGTGEETANFGFFGMSLLKDDNDNFILGGCTSSAAGGSISDSSRGLIDMWLIKLDSAGNKIWDKRYGGSANDFCTHIIHTKDNGYMVSGITVSPQGLDVSEPSRGVGDFWVLKLDSLGNKQWDRRYGGDKDDYATWMEEAPGGGYWVGGYTNSTGSIFTGTGEVTEYSYDPNNLNDEDYWIIKIDSVGNKLFDKRLGSAQGNACLNFIILDDSSIVMCGSASTGISGVKTDSGKGGVDYWIIRFKYDDYTIGLLPTLSKGESVNVWPNPAKENVTVESSRFKVERVEVYNMHGEKVLQQEVKNQSRFTLNIQGLNSGVYIIKALTEVGYAVGKIVIN